MASFMGDLPLPSKLLYRGSRDGFDIDTWQKRCLGHSPTLTLMRVKESSNIFGVYFAGTWAQCDRFDPLARDESRDSFLFSLRNELGRSLRWQLHNSSRPVARAPVEDEGSVWFGTSEVASARAEDRPFSWTLMTDSFPRVGLSSFELDTERSTGPSPPLPIDIQPGFLSGSSYIAELPEGHPPMYVFACDEVEVYGMA
jgi:hypothetical protein